MSWQGNLIKAGIDSNGTGLTFVNGGGGTKWRIYSKKSSMEDDATISLPIGKIGFVLVSDETDKAQTGLFSVFSDATVVKIGGTSNTVATDTDAKLCVFDGGTSVSVRNRLGGTKTIGIVFIYFDA
jgi:hypothetical protein